MIEEKVRKRGWVKNATIIFLSVMLVLTFFSNTIMNHSLPEVAAQYAQSGTITTRIRGTGTVEANEVYEVIFDQSREVESVAVRVGDPIEAGDVLFYLADKDSDELKQAESALDTLKYQYQEAILNASQGDYAVENRDIQLAREALEEAIADRDAKTITEQEVQDKKNAVKAIEEDISARKTTVALLQANVDEAQANLDALGGRVEGGDNSGLYAAMQVAQDALTDAQNALGVAQLRYQERYVLLQNIVIFLSPSASDSNYNLSLYTAAKAADYAEADATVPEIDTWSFTDPISAVDESDPNYVTVTAASVQHKLKKTDLAEAYIAIEDAKNKVETCWQAYQQAQIAYNDSCVGGNTIEYDRLAEILKLAQKDLATAQSGLEQAQINLEAAQTALTEAETCQTEFKAAAEAVKTAQTNLEDKIFALQEQQKDDDKNQSLQALQLNKLKDQLADAEAEVERLLAGSVDAAVVSKVSGVVKSLSVSAGNMAEPGTPLATILVPDRGYAVSITVTADQAKKVTVGDSAEVTTGGWGGNDITAQLVTIRPDPSAPNQKRILVFDIGGEVEDGTQLSLSIGQKSRNFDIVVPNSAVRSDANGDFVLIVVAKSSPLGNRYVATRVDVQVLEVDDLNTAVSGGVANGDFVITNSTRPLESGMQVRLAEG